MKDCWETQPELRPSFSELVTHLSSHLDAIADYLDFFASAGKLSVIENRAVNTIESTAIKSAIAEESVIAVDSPVVIVSNKRAESDVAMDSQSAIIEETSVITSSTSGTEDGLVVVNSAVGRFKTATLESSNAAEDCSVIFENAADAGAIESRAETEEVMNHLYN